MDTVCGFQAEIQDTDSVIHLSRIYSEDIMMSYRVGKCGRIVAKRATVIWTAGVDLPVARYRTYN